MQHVE